MAAFAHEPLDAASACIAVIDSHEDPSVTIPRYRQLGAPVFFAVHQEKLQWWSQSAQRPLHLRTLEPAETAHFFAEHREELAPERIYRAKTRGPFEEGYQLDFVDIGLMPLVEEEMGKRLGDLVEHAVVRAREHLARRMTSQLGSWLFRSVFWLLAAKILRDKRVRGFESLDLTGIEQVFSCVSQHYDAHEDHGFTLLAENRRRALEEAGEIISSFASLAHVTTESLASVYENTLVSKKTRTALGTHSTPAFLARYVVWRLAPWISEMAPENRNVLEPTCGQGSFLVAAMRLLRDDLPGDMSPTERKVYLRRHLHGIDIDSFAIELARLSLTLADIPNPDGWDLRCANVFTDSKLSDLARKTTILLANPPFENFNSRERADLASRGVEARWGYKATELCRRILRLLPPSAVFGIVMPRGFIVNERAIDVRTLLVEDFELAEIALFPDKIFTYSNAESALLLGRRRNSRDNRGNVRYVRVREPDAKRFRSTHMASSERVFAQDRFAATPDHSFLVPELEEVWEACNSLPNLKEIAKIGKGLEHKSAEGKGRDKLPEDAMTVSSEEFEGASLGFAGLDKGLMIHQQPSQVWINLDRKVIRRKGLGSETGIPQVLVNHSPVKRGPWCVKAFIDRKGRAAKGRFLILRPRHANISLTYIWALLNSPLANAYCYTHSTKRDVLKKTLDSLPVPRITRAMNISGVEKTVEAYFRAVRGAEETRAVPHPFLARDSLLAVDAEILRLYGLPPNLERQILDSLAGYQRRGVPFVLDRYLPESVRTSRRVAPSVIAQFWKAFEHRIDRGAEVFAFVEPVELRMLRNALRQPVIDTPNINTAYTFFVDQRPEANWAHDCAYAFVACDGRTAWCDAKWPPDEDFDLEPMAQV